MFAALQRQHDDQQMLCQAERAVPTATANVFIRHHQDAVDGAEQEMGSGSGNPGVVSGRNTAGRHDIDTVRTVPATSVVSQFRSIEALAKTE